MNPDGNVTLDGNELVFNSGIISEWFSKDYNIQAQDLAWETVVKTFTYNVSNSIVNPQLDGVLSHPTISNVTDNTANIAVIADANITNKRVVVYSDASRKTVVTELDSTQEITWLTPNTQYFYTVIGLDKNEETNEQVEETINGDFRTIFTVSEDTTTFSEWNEWATRK